MIVRNNFKMYLKICNTKHFTELNFINYNLLEKVKDLQKRYIIFITDN